MCFPTAAVDLSPTAVNTVKAVPGSGHYHLQDNALNDLQDVTPSATLAQEVQGGERGRGGGREGRRGWKVGVGVGEGEERGREGRKAAARERKVRGKIEG